MAGQQSSDVLTPEQRSYCMSRIKGKDTKPEVQLRKTLWALGYRYRLHYKLSGKPDIVFPRQKIAIFVDGCFWHGCPDHFRVPKSRSEFWQKKIQSNIDRDLRNNSLLKEEGWTVLRLWEHDINKDILGCINSIAETFSLNSRPPKKNPRTGINGPNSSVPSG